MLRFLHAKNPARRATISASLTLVGALFLSGCTADVPTLQAEPAAAGVIKSGDDALALQLEAVPRDSAHALEIPGVSLWVQQTHVADSVPSEVGQYVVTNVDRLDVEAADGEEFLISEVMGGAPTFLPEEALPGAATEVRILIHGEEIDLHDDFLAETLTEYNPTVWFMLSIPTDSGPEDVVLEVTHDDRVQRLSLLTGERIESDIEAYYGASFTASVADTWWEFRDEATSGDEIVTAGLVRGVEVSPLLAGEGWAAPDHAFVGVTTEHISQVDGFTHSGGLTLTLPDGTVIEPIASSADSFEAEEPATTWFEIPLKTQTAVLTIGLSGTLTNPGTQLDFGSVDAEISFGD